MEKMERWHRDNQKVISLFYFWDENMLSSFIRGLFKLHFKHMIQFFENEKFVA